MHLALVLMLLQGVPGVPDPIFTPRPIPAPTFPPPQPLSPQLQKIQKQSDTQLLIGSAALASGMVVVAFVKYWFDKRADKKKRRSPIETDEERNRRMGPNRKRSAKHY